MIVYGSNYNSYDIIIPYTLQKRFTSYKAFSAFLIALKSLEGFSNFLTNSSNISYLLSYSSSPD